MTIIMTMISTIMRPMTIMTKTAEPMSYLIMKRRIVATMMTEMTIVFLATTAEHHNMDPMLPLLLTIIMRTVPLITVAHLTMADLMALPMTIPPSPPVAT